MIQAQMTWATSFSAAVTGSDSRRNSHPAAAMQEWIRKRHILKLSEPVSFSFDGPSKCFGMSAGFGSERREPASTLRGGGVGVGVRGRVISEDGREIGDTEGGVSDMSKMLYVMQGCDFVGWKNSSRQRESRLITS